MLLISLRLFATRIIFFGKMALASIVAEVECYVIHDGIRLPKSTFQSELLRLQREEGFVGVFAAEFGPEMENATEAIEFICKHYGRSCWHCGQQIDLCFGIEPQLRKPDGADQTVHLHYACWKRVKSAAHKKRRRVRYTAQRAAQAAGYEPQPMLALPAPMLALSAPTSPEPEEEPHRGESL